ncbi:MAG: universal stress protein [Acidimicrobiales bacterium]
MSGPVRLIVVGVDGSAAARAALDWAVAAGRAFGAEVAAVHAVGVQEAAAGEAVRAAFEGEWTAGLDEVAHRRLLRYGPPELALLAAVRELDADLVVVASRGLGGAAVVGSTSQHLVETCPTPLVIVPGAERRL